MARDLRQIESLLRLVTRLSRGRLSLGAVVVLAVAAVLYVLVLQPAIERSAGIRLPSIVEEEPSVESPPPTGSKQRTEEFEPSDLGGLLAETGRDEYRSPAGLVYTRGSQHGHRLTHVMAHTRDRPGREGSHGVFDNGEPTSVIRLIDQAYQQAQSGEATRTRREGDRTTHTVDLGRRIGYVGGSTGARRRHPPADKLRLVVEGNRLITAYPTDR